MAEENKHNRRQFIATAAMSVAAAQLGPHALAKAQRNEIPRSSLTFAQIKPGSIRESRCRRGHLLTTPQLSKEPIACIDRVSFSPR